MTLLEMLKEYEALNVRLAMLRENLRCLYEEQDKRRKYAEENGLVVPYRSDFPAQTEYLEDNSRESLALAVKIVELMVSHSNNVTK